ncbi:MAG: phosphodiester glycosidase family protein [Candidatus Caldatribacterium sp.]|nr:phosphodiester glycosidase family protein [Candidatus Caldatribacterium sp.]
MRYLRPCILWVLVFVLLFGLSLEVSAQVTPVTWGDFLGSLKNILGTAPSLPPGKREGDPVLRLEAVEAIVKALSYDDLLSFVDTQSVPFRDLADLGEREKRLFLLAASLEPPLLRGDISGNVFPKRVLSAQEFIIIKETLKKYAKGNIRFERRKSIHPNLELVVKKWGFSPLEAQLLPQPTGAPQDTFFLQVGAYEVRERAERVAGWLRELGYQVHLEEEGGLFKVRVGPYKRKDLEDVRSRLEKQGFPSYPVATQGGGKAKEALPPGPFFTLALLFEPSNAPFRLEVALAKDQVTDRERTSEIARRKNALFAMNASFFAENGIPIGLLMVDGRVLSEPREGWYAAGFTDSNRLVIGETRFVCKVLGLRGEVEVNGINRPAGKNEVVLYDSFFGGQTPKQGGVEVIVRRGVVEEIRPESQGETPIPRDGFVLFGRGEGGEVLRRTLSPGDRVRVRMVLYAPGKQIAEWQRVRYAVSGGPLLFFEGQPGPFGDFSSDIVAKRHPRTVVASLEDGRILFLVVDGRRPGHSVGMTVEELVEELKTYRVSSALNLDGGGSTTFYLEGKVLNLPSDLTGERKVSSAILLCPK